MTVAYILCGLIGNDTISFCMCLIFIDSGVVKNEYNSAICVSSRTAYYTEHFNFNVHNRSKCVCEMVY